MNLLSKLNTRKIITFGSLVCIVLLLFLSVVPIPVHKTLSAIEIKLDDPSYSEMCDITINGFYHFNPLSVDFFEGSISVSGYSQTTQTMARVRFHKDGTALYYNRMADDLSDGNEQKRLEYCLGRLMSKRFFRNMVITVFSENPLDKGQGWKEGGSWGTWNERNGYCIVPGAHNYTEGIQKLRLIGVIS